MPKVTPSIRLFDGTLPRSAWPGMYPLAYSYCGDIYCADCVNSLEGLSEDKLAYDVHWEGEPLYCDACSAEIASAYGEVE